MNYRSDTGCDYCFPKSFYFSASAQVLHIWHIGGGEGGYCFPSCVARVCWYAVTCRDLSWGLDGFAGASPTQGAGGHQHHYDDGNRLFVKNNTHISLMALAWNPVYTLLRVRVQVEVLGYIHAENT